jgi:subtilisin family serine protease
MIVRNKLASVFAGGPRQFAELRDEYLLRADDPENIESIISELDNINLDGESLDNTPVLVVEPQDRIESVIESVTDVSGSVGRGIEEIQEAREEEEDIIDATQATIDATQAVFNELDALENILNVEFVRTEADFGPANLRLNPDSMDNLGRFSAQDAEANIEDVYERFGIYDAHEVTRGENAISCIFDTGYAEDLIAEERIVDTFHGESVDSVYASAEGHGSMCAGAMAANSEEGVPFDGVAPESGVILVRTTDSNGQIKTSTISKAWDWLTSLDTDRPIVANHSYGTPLCSGRPKQKFCGTSVNDVIATATSSANITAFYAAGNEAMRCGHRPSGITNAITGTNSIQEVITIGALLSSGREAQRYSSHGRGDCAPISDPKPNVSFPIPKVTYYGGEDGWKLKDMSTGPYGSGGGTSHASPTSAGIGVLMQSKAVEDAGGIPEENQQQSNNQSTGSRINTGAMQTEEIKQILHDTAVQPRSTQINSFSLFFSQEGYDARFGHGRIDPVAALEEV